MIKKGKIFLLILEGKLFVTQQDKASKDTFFKIHLIWQCNLGLKFTNQKLKMSHGEGGGGSEKCDKMSRII